MRILWLSHFLPFPPKGGALQRTYHLLREAARRFEVHLVGLNQPAILPTHSEVREAVHALSGICASVRVFPIPAERSHSTRLLNAALAFLRPLPYDVYWLRSGLLARHVHRQAGAEWGLVHADTLGLLPYARLLSRVPVVLNHHNIESHMMLRRALGEPNFLKRVYFRREHEKLLREERRVCGSAAVNLVVSDLDAARLAETTGPVTTAIIPNGVDTTYFRPVRSLGHGAGGIVFVGRLNWYPNAEAMRFLAKEIWPALAQDRASRTLTVAGKHPPEELVQLGLDDPRVRVLGFVEDVRPVLDDASIYICPIRTGGGTRLKVLDALSMAKPLVATGLAVEGLGLVEERDYLRAETAAEYVIQVRRLEEHPDLRQRLAQAGREYVERHFDWGVIGKSLETVYRSVAVPSSRQNAVAAHARSRLD